MRTHASIVATATLTMGLLVSPSGCKGGDTDNPEEAGDNLLGPSSASGGGGEGLGGDEFAAEEDDFGFDDGDLESDETVAEADDRSKLPPRAEPKKRCRGRGKKRKCTMVDPKPRVSAAYGVRTLMGGFRWGMTPDQVLKVLAKDIETEYEERQKQASGAMEQDRNREWRNDQIQAIKANHVKFTSASKHRWGVSLIQYEYEDDANEEMLWVKTSPTLRKFYFFKDNELWKILYAYSTDTWPGQSYKEVKEEKFKKWFGHSPKEKVKKDPKSGDPLIKYTEWTALNKEKIRAFDMGEIHGVYVLSVIDGRAEDRIGERLPNRPEKEEFSDTVNDVLGEGDVCYNSEGDIVTCDTPAGYVD